MSTNFSYQFVLTSLQAGGLALTGKNRIMDIPPTDVHQRVPCILGSRDDILEMRRYYVESRDPELIARCRARLKGTSALNEDEVNFPSSEPPATLGNEDGDDDEDGSKEGSVASIGEFGAAQ